MKNIEFLVKFENGQEEYFYCSEFKEAIIIASYWAYESTIKSNIESIKNQYGEKIIKPEIKWTVVL